MQAFGCRHGETIPTLGEPASETVALFPRLAVVDLLPGAIGTNGGDAGV